MKIESNIFVKKDKPTTEGLNKQDKNENLSIFEESLDLSQSVGSNQIRQGSSTYKNDGSEFNFFNNGDTVEKEFIIKKGADTDSEVAKFEKALPNLTPEENIDETNGSAKVNGELDEQTKQGQTGDCWLLSSMNALNSTARGKQIIKDSIKENEDGSVTVSYNGIGVSYNVSADEIALHDTDDNLRDAYSNGDNDMLVMELATEKLIADITDGKVNVDDSASMYLPTYGKRDITGGFPSQMLYYLTGSVGTVYANESDLITGLSHSEVTSALTDAYRNKDTSALTFELYGTTKHTGSDEGAIPHQAQLVDGSTYNYTGGGHAFAITGVDESTVTFVNPWDTEKEYTMQWDEFVNTLRVRSFNTLDLDKLDQKDYEKDPFVINW